jgi:hypothetical protein
MAHGGSNFGFYNGANTGADEADYKPDLTSYDYVRNFLTHCCTFYCKLWNAHHKLDYLICRMLQSGKLVMLTIQNSKVACVFILFSSYQNFIFQFVGNIILYVSLFLVSTYVSLPQNICFNDKQTIVSHLLRKGF